MTTKLRPIVEPVFRTDHDDNCILYMKMAEDDKIVLNLYLRWFSENGHYWRINEVVRYGAQIEHHDNAPLRLAAANGQLTTVHTLVEKQADVNSDGGSPLTSAAMNGHYETVRYLVNVGANVNASNGAALHYALQNGHRHIAELLVANGGQFRTDDMRNTFEAMTGIDSTSKQ